MSRAVELMVAHVEHLRRQNHKSVADLEEAKKLSQQQSVVSPRACSGRPVSPLAPSPTSARSHIYRKRFQIRRTATAKCGVFSRYPP